MGQSLSSSLPLPERIPNPEPEVKTRMEECGITIESSEAVYVSYDLPSGWKLVDQSDRADLPQFYIVDTEDKGRFKISGSWKGTYDNELKIYIVASPEVITPMTTVSTPSETNGKTIAQLATSAIAKDVIERLPGTIDDLTKRKNVTENVLLLKKLDKM